MRKLVTACFLVSCWMSHEIQVLASCNTWRDLSSIYKLTLLHSDSSLSLSLWNQPTTGIALPFIPPEKHGLAASWWVAAAAHPALQQGPRDTPKNTYPTSTIHLGDITTYFFSTSMYPVPPWDLSVSEGPKYILRWQVFFTQCILHGITLLAHCCGFA